MDHQGMALELIDAITMHDQPRLAELTPAELAEQVSTRETLYNYIDRIWEDAKDRGLNPAVRPEWSVVAGLRDLTHDLHMRAWELQLAAEEAADQ